MQYQIADDEQSCRALAEHLLAPSRKRPVAVVSTQSGSRTPLVDIDQLSSELAGDADVFVVVTSAATFVLADILGDRGTVYGGAARVYPVGTDWVKDSRHAPLRFCHGPDEADRTLRQIIRDAETCLTAKSSSKPAPTLTHRPFADLGSLTIISEPAQRTTAKPAPPKPTPAPPASEPTPQPEPAAKPAVEEKPAPPKPTDPIALVAAAMRAAAGQPEPETPAAPTPKGALRNALATIDQLRADIGRLTAQHRAEIGRIAAAGRDENASLRAELAQAEATLRDLRTARRPAPKTAKPKADTDTVYLPDAFPTIDEAIIEAVRRTWIERIPAHDKATLPLSDYVLGSMFADSFTGLDRTFRAKALKCIVDVVTGLARDNASREMHVLRTGAAGNESATTRDDGAVCWRAYIEAKTPSARRLHFWKLPDGGIELSRIVLHDDVSP